MLAIRVVKMAIHQIVDVVAVGNGLMAAVRTMLVRRIVSVALVPVGAIVWVCGVHFEFMLIDVTVVKRMQMAVMQVIGMVVVDDRGVAAVFAVLMRMVLVDLVLV